MTRYLLLLLIVFAMLCGCSRKEPDRDEYLARFYPRIKASGRAMIHETEMAGKIERMTFIAQNSDVYEISYNADRAIELMKNTERGLWGEFPVLVCAVYCRRNHDKPPTIMLEYHDLHAYTVRPDIRVVVLAAPVTDAVDSPYRQLHIRVTRSRNLEFELGGVEIKRVPMEWLLPRATPSPDDPTIGVIEVSADAKGHCEIPDSEQLTAFVVNRAGHRSNGVRVMEIRADTEGGRYTRAPFGDDMLEWAVYWPAE